MITDYTFVEWPQAQVPASANFALGRYFWLFLGLVLLLAIAYMLTSQTKDRKSRSRLGKGKEISLSSL